MTIKKLFVFISLICVVTVGVFIFTGCTPTEQKAIQNFGQDKAYMRTNSGVTIQLKDGKAVYNVGSDVTGDYLRISEYAVGKANNLSSRINVYIANNTRTGFKFTMHSDENGLNAINTYSTDANGNITSSTISYNRHYMDSYSYSGKQHIALHEMGHTLGLGDINDNRMEGNTVMFFSYSNGSKDITDYTKFDKYNITWKYGD
ncbi:MAG: hypothetical protein IJF75_06140 [Clostridia bacterium]|nr:hypothetical protein [Clostridia bacterium]